jgi:serine phosphatase RsbU (regulator of sigma subunit)/anti-sigma regulatory factor (Ser/Thr protein kinase)
MTPLGGPRDRHPWLVAVVMVLVCLLLTAASTAAASRADASTERRLLQGQSRQAAAVLSAAVQLIQEPLRTALGVERVTGDSGDTSAFRHLMTSYVQDNQTFVSASLWKRTGSTMTRLVNVGVPPSFTSGSSATAAFLRGAFATPTFTVRTAQVGNRVRLGYAQGDRASGMVVYAERLLPADRSSPVAKDSAFADLHYAIYLGDRADDTTLSTTDAPLDSLPLRGRTARTTIPFGDTNLIMITSARHHLGAPLSRNLPWILLLGGLLITAAAGLTAFQLVRGRQRAEQSILTAADLYAQVETLYDEQRALAVRLQRALLPHVNPDIPGLDIASEYVAGAIGVDIGGDWYSIIGLDEDHFGFVVGDVSGHGVDAVAVMAHARFTLRAYLLDGKSPAEALEKCSYQFDITLDGHMTTALVGLGNQRTGEITLATAGHPRPLRINGEDSSFISVPTGPPLGTGPTPYRSTTVQLAPGEVFFAFTDGLVERRNEDIDTGLDRLVSTLREGGTQSVAGMVDHALASLRHAHAPDDIAVLAFRWGGPSSPAAATASTARSVERIELPANEAAPRQARAFINERMSDPDPDSGPGADEVVLVVSELVTNAVRAGARSIELTLGVDGEKVEVVVSDDASGWPTPRVAATEDLGGRGLTIVDQLTTSWSATATEAGKSVRATWAETEDQE